MRNHTKLRAFELANQLGFHVENYNKFDEHFIETEKVLGALIRSLRKPK